jgi:cytochrome P450
MALNPHVARKAQEELDRVVGGDRLPDLSDQEDLPYISAILKELLRWGCPTPIGVPKRVIEDDTYDGYFIPAGATVIENIWWVSAQALRQRCGGASGAHENIRAMFYDESTYPSPHTYDPERYLKDGKLDPSVKDPEERIFGSGRRCEFCDNHLLTSLRQYWHVSYHFPPYRICPGRHFAVRTLFLDIARVLALFDIEAPVGEDLEAKFLEEGFSRYVYLSPGFGFQQSPCG